MHVPRLILPFALLLTAPVLAQTASEVPYWAAIRASEVNMRVGPGEDYRIAWVYKRKQLPLKVLRVMDGWRLVEDPDGARGWMLARFLARQDSAIVRGKGLAEMRETADPAARLLWRLEPGVVGLVDECDGTWCRFTTGPHRGFVRRDRLWGATEAD
jgi:SH3-like domain-containing protein